MLMANVLAFHTGENLNKSNVTESAAKKAIKEMAYKPVLANFCEIDGVRDFTSHDFEIDDDGNVHYQEKQVGCFTADVPYLEKDHDNENRMNVYAKVAIPRNYTDAADIIERKNGTACSVELSINELSWDSQSKVLLLNDIDVMGLTLLGKNPDSGEDVKPGMSNAHVQLEDFSLENNSLTFHSTFVEDIAEAVFKRIRKNIKEGGNNNLNDLVKEDLNQEDFSENIDDTVDENTVSEDFKNENNEDENNNLEYADDEGEEDPVTDDGVLNNGQQGKKNYVEYTVNFNGEVKTFSVSMKEKLEALYELINATYSEADNTWYDVDAYDDEKIVIMHDYWYDKHYRQSYSVKNGVYSLKGDRTQVYCTYLSEDEKKQLENMKANYSLISDKLSKYESEPEKMNILNSKDYLNIMDQKDFEELKKQENHFDLSIDEVKEKADAMLLAYAKSGKLNFAAIEQNKKEEPKKDFFAFAKIGQDTSFLDGLLRNNR